jgi:hypothetical protein
MAILNSYEPDECCGDRISKALRSGALENKDSWTCPKCGMEWTPHSMGRINHWFPRTLTAIVR